MTSPYTNLTPEEENAHLNMDDVVGYNGVYPSGEAHFFDRSQNFIDEPSQAVQSDTSIFNFNNLDSTFSNATESYVIDDFTIFNPYRHNTNKYNFSTSELLELATIKYNIYSNNFRRWF